MLRAVSAQKSSAAKAANSNIAFNALAGATLSGVEMNKRALFIADGRPLEGVMEALLTNREDKGGPGTVALVLERRHEGASG
jgi:hypothetical protein